MKENKICGKCGKIHNEWLKGTQCNKCIQDFKRKYYQENKEKIKQRVAKNYQENKEEKLAYAKSYRKNNKDKLDKYFNDNADRIYKQRAEREKRRRKEDIGYCIQSNLRRRMLRVLKGNWKSDITRELFGCSAEELKQHLEQQFQEGMTWDNYGVKGWHIDHIMPCDSFDFTKEADQRACFHYTNLQPLWAIDNIRKSNKIIKQ